jgi:hypothetical protein
MNAISVIFPYKFQGQWVFDDKSRGLDKEPFIMGIDQIIEKSTESIPSAQYGFKLFFSSTPFPGYTVKLEWVRGELGGNWYRCEQLGIQGWLCPALLKFFEKAPTEIYAKPEPKET